MSILKKSKLLAIGFLFLFVFFINKQIKAQCHIDDWTALKALYESTDGDNWKNNGGWDIVKASTPAADCDLENLNGVSLNENGRVDRLVVVFNQLKGSIPPEIGKLNNLRHLTLNTNQLNGSIPAEIGNLSNLTHLKLYANQLSGGIPVELSKLSKLQELDLSNNDLIDSISIDLENLRELTSLSLNGNAFSGNIPAQLSNLSKLTYLNLRNNELNGSISAQLGNLPNLTDLYLGNNYLSGSIPAQLGNLSNLTYLGLGYNQLSNNIPPELGNLGKLTTLALSSNELTNDIPAELGNLSSLEELQLGYNQLIGSIPSELGNLKKLTYLSLNNNQLSGEIPLEISSLINLTDIRLNQNQLVGNIPTELGNLSNLENLLLYENKLSGEIPEELGNLNKLILLHLANNQLIGSIPIELGNLSSLEELDLEDNQLSGSIPSELSNCSRLIELWLSNNQLSGNIPVELGSLSNLKELYLSNNQLNGEIPVELGNLSMLSALWLNHNELSGSISSELGNLINLKKMYLNNNQLAGSIPIEIGNLSMLSVLLLNSNQLSGSIPVELGNLSMLTNLRLNNNQLNGNIPTELSNLSNMTQLHLEYNYFSCEGIEGVFFLKEQVATFNYLPQYYSPVNYETIKTTITDTSSIDRSFRKEIIFPFDTAGLAFQWFWNGVKIPETRATPHIETITREFVGKYTLEVKSDHCFADGSDFVAISDAIYIILKGYDLYGQPVEYDQIMVSFNSTEETEKFEQSILTPNAGWPKKACNCNRELYLWQFPSTEKAVAALLAIDQKTKTLKERPKAKGGFNNNLSIVESGNSALAYKVISDTFSKNYPDSVAVYILDSGLDENNYNAAPFLYKNAPVDNCYGSEKSSGYSYVVDSIMKPVANYLDDVWHGTFGFRLITSDLAETSKLKLVPLKIFDENGGGTLFDLVCALYHAIDHNADIINISAGYQGEPSEILEKAVNLAREKGIFITAAAGNDTLNIDDVPQYPAFYAGQYYKFSVADLSGNLQLDSIKLDNVISVASIGADKELSQFSNFGRQSVTLATYGENIHSYGLVGLDAVASGTSMATNLATKALALEIANDNKRDYQKIWQDFEANWLVVNPHLENITQTSKHIKFNIEVAEIEGCTNETNCYYFPFATIEDGSCLPVFINLPNVSDQSSNYFHANDSIFSNSIIESLDTVIYKSGDLISLTNGFEVKVNATFKAEIEPCQ